MALLGDSCFRLSRQLATAPLFEARAKNNDSGILRSRHQIHLASPSGPHDCCHCDYGGSICAVIRILLGQPISIEQDASCCSARDISVAPGSTQYLSSLQTLPCRSLVSLKSGQIKELTSPLLQIQGCLFSWLTRSHPSSRPSGKCRLASYPPRPCSGRWVLWS